jgi:hypothetical protein
MKIFRTTLLAVLCFASSAICLGQNQGTSPFTPNLPDQQQPRAYTLPLPLYSKSKIQTIVDNIQISDSLFAQKQMERTKKKAMKKRKKYSKVFCPLNENVICCSDEGVTFAVDGDLPEIDDKFFNHLLNGDKVAKGILSDMETPHKLKVIASSFPNDSLALLGKDIFYRSIIKAYASHRSIVLSPDMIWLLISQGFSRYVNAHPEQLCDQLVNHTGRIDLMVQSHEDLLSGHPDWTKLLDGFCIQIEENTKGNLTQTITANFSTTGAAERIPPKLR